MKVGILTFARTNNYGATLQCYALSEFLKKNGCEVIIINVPLLYPGKSKKISFLIKIYLKFNMLFKYIFKHKSYLLIRENKRYKRNINQQIEDNKYDKLNMNEFEKFRSKYLPEITKEYFSKSDFEKEYPEADLYIVGSDQVWNNWVTNIQYDIFFFSFLKSGSKRISYAPSFGGSSKWTYDTELTCKIKDLLLQFNKISVRDIDSMNILNNVFKLQGEAVLDPTFLIDNYDELLNDSNLDAKGNMFCFKFIINDYWADVIQFMAKELNLSVRMDSCLIPIKDFPFNPVTSIPDWLRLIKTSDFVFTDSFHGMVFCILFKKQFVVTPSYANGEGRYKDLAEKLGLEDRLYTKTQDVYSHKEIWKKKINYNLVYEKIESLRYESKDFLFGFIK